MGDLLSAFGLLVAAVTALYSMWVPSLEALSLEEAGVSEGQKAAFKTRARSNFLRRALPLALVATSMVLLLAPPFAQVVANLVDVLVHNKFQASDYDPIAGMFAVVYSVCCILAVSTCGLAIKVLGLIRAK